MKKIVITLNKLKRNLVKYVLTNKLFLSYVLIAILGTGLSRYFTLNEFYTVRSFFANIGIIIMLGSFGYLIKAKNRFKYYFILIVVFTLIEFINTIYYKFYTSFASFSELATASQAETVAGSVIDRMEPLDFIFFLFPIIFYLIHSKLKNSTYYNFIGKAEKRKALSSITLGIGAICLAFVLVTSTSTDYGRLAKQWNKVLNVERFGLIFYQFNDLVQTLTPRISSLFGYDDAAELFNEYYDAKEPNEPNSYTGIMEGKNVVFVHMESMQTFLMDMSFNGVEVTPYLNDLAEEGIFFSNFYPQISTGTSSDSEFSLLSGLYPAASGTVFVSYNNRNYVTVPKILAGEGYNTFSMHGNNFSMWERKVAHPNLGYEEFYYKDEYTFEEEDIIGLGINDQMFFEQTLDYLVEIENRNQNYMGTLITLTNHSPFSDVSKYIDYDISSLVEIENEEGVLEETTTDYLSDLSIGRYLKSSHYADMALGEFITSIKESENFNDTVFVFYGDHDAKFSQSEINYLYNYDPATGELKDELEPTYITYDSFDHELNKSTPLVIWSKNEELAKSLTGEITYPMGMVDISPTILNMMNLENPYALGKDIFSIKEDNYIVFPNASFITSDIYYNNSTNSSKIINEGFILEDGYIEKYMAIADEELSVSNAIIVHDLIEKEVYNKEEE